MIWHCRYMRSHGRYRIEEGCAILYSCAVYGICIVTAPYLWTVVEHACIKSSTATAAALKKYIRISCHQTLHKIIHSKHIVVCKISCIHISHASVHIPLHVVDFSLIKHCADLIENIVPDFFSRKV